jgi:hypothetical protein
MTTENNTEPAEPTTKPRMNWENVLFEQCREYESATGRHITASHMIYPGSPAVCIRVDDELPRSFASAKEAAVAVGIWQHAPGARKEGAQ